MSNALAVDLKEDIWTYEDYLTLPNDGKKYQIIGGNLYMSPPPIVYHQTVSRNLEFILWEFVKKHSMGDIFFAPIGVVFDNTNVVEPDIIYISNEKMGIKKEKAIFGAPDLIIEILSPSTLKVDVLLKKTLYQRFGVREYWMIDPKKKKVEVYFLEEGQYILQGIFSQQDTVEVKTIQGLKVDLADVF